MSVALERPAAARPAAGPQRDPPRRAGSAGSRPGDLAERFGTPLYVYDLDVVDRQVAALRAVLPPVVELAYAVKANPALAVVAHLGRLGLGADVASGGELRRPRPRRDHRGSDRHDRPGQARRRAARRGRGRDPGGHGGIARRAGPARGDRRGRRPACNRSCSAPPSPRAPGSSASGSSATTAPASSGWTPRTWSTAARRALGVAAPRAARAPRVRGVERPRRERASSAHVAATVATARRMAARRRARRFASSTPAAGSASRTKPHEESLDLVRLGAGLAEIVAGWAADPLLRDARLLLEPGRFLVGPAGAYLARVVDRKTVDGSIVVILDGGVHHVLRPALVGQEHRVRALGDASRAGGHAAGCSRSPSPGRCAPVSTSSARPRS